jgi:hypothetical protein
MKPDVKHLHLASRDHEASRRFYETYFEFHFDSTFPRGDEPAATIIRSPTGFQICLEGASDVRLPRGSTSGSSSCRPRRAASFTSSATESRSFIRSRQSRSRTISLQIPTSTSCRSTSIPPRSSPRRQGRLGGRLESPKRAPRCLVPPRPGRASGHARRREQPCSSHEPSNQERPQSRSDP